MKSSAKHIKLTSYEKLFQSEEERIDEKLERVQVLALDQLVPFAGHPFYVRDDQRMQETVESIKEHGVLVPILVRPTAGEKYEIVSGHRRSRASFLAGLETVPAIVRDLDDDVAIIAMVDSNLQRESILPSEKAFAYQMKLEALNRRLGRPSRDITKESLGKRSTEILGAETGESGKQVQRYLRLTNLNKEILSFVDDGDIALNTAVEVSYLLPQEQDQLVRLMQEEGIKPSCAQGKQLKAQSKNGDLTMETMESILIGNTKNSTKLVLKDRRLDEIFPADMSATEREYIVMQLLLERHDKEKR